MSLSFTFEVLDRMIEMKIAKKWKKGEDIYAVEILGIQMIYYHKTNENEAYEGAFRMLKQEPALTAAMAQYIVTKCFVKDGDILTSYK